MYNEKMPRVGESILFFANSDDAIALSNGKKMGDPVAAIVTQAWSPITVNLKLIPDHAAMQDRGSVTHKTAMPEGGGYYWLFPDEYYNDTISKGGGEKIPAGTFDGINNRRNRLDLMHPSEKAIHDAMQEVEKVGADIVLTEAITLLSQAKDLVSSFLDKAEFVRKLPNI